MVARKEPFNGTSAQDGCVDAPIKPIAALKAATNARILLISWLQYERSYRTLRPAWLLPELRAVETGGIKHEQRSRWKRAVDATNDALGQVVGKLYVAKYFPESAKTQLDTMVANITAAYGNRINALTWMSPETKGGGEKQFDQYKPFSDLGVNGHQTLGENIADLAGLAASYDAYIASLHGKEAPTVDGLTSDQQFFLAYAQSWRIYKRPEALRHFLINDGHAPAQYRTFTVRNLDPWYAAFHIKETDKLYLAPKDRVRVW